jgi:uncharacterized membrane protein
MWAIGLIVGAMLGLGMSWGHGAGMTLGALAGLVLGLLLGKWKRTLAERAGRMEARIDGLERAIDALRVHVPSELVPATEALAPDAARPLSDEASVVERTSAESPQPAPAVEIPAAPLPVRKGGSGAGRVEPSAAAEGRAGAPLAAPPTATAPAWLNWVTGGNTLARVGVVLLFIGVGFLIKFASEHVHIPIEVRLSAVALGGVALLIFGWRLRTRRHAYAMILQGGGVGVLYLIVFGALRLYTLIPTTAAFVLMVSIAALSGWLAVRQDAIALAALGVVGGFLAPVLTSSHAGSHVVLFTYYALLNAGIFGIAWFKAWRSLNLLGFVFTFIVATLWGVTRYRPEDFSTTEPFLVLFFLFYVAIAVLYALRQSVQLRNYVDGALVFGTPLVAAGLQSGLVRNIPYAMAWSALAASALYLILAKALLSRRAPGVRLLIEAFFAMGVIFATLAVPLALDARWTSATWALEGAAMLWLGAHQRRLALRIFGLLLQLAAGIAFGLGLSPWSGAPPASPLPVLNSECLGALAVALAGIFSAWQMYRRRADLDRREHIASSLVLGWGLLWWLGAGWREIEHWIAPEARRAMLVGFLSLTAALLSIAERRLVWPVARVPAVLLLPALLLIALAATLTPWHMGAHLFADGGAIAWLIAAVVLVVVARAAERGGAAGEDTVALPLDWWHGGLLWLIVLVAAEELAWLGSRVGSGEGVWRSVPWGLVPALALAVVGMLVTKPAWPVGTHRRAYLIIGAAPVAALLAIWSLAANVKSDGDPLPLPYVPIFNPLDLVEAIAISALAGWMLRVHRGDIETGVRGAERALSLQAIGAILSVLLFVWINAIALRTIHFWFDVPYTLADLWDSRLVQAVISLLWASVALATMLFANRRSSRPAWISGAALLGLVVAKLFLVDLSQVGGVERIVSFIGVGVLLLLIGYFAPVPPRRAENAS